MPPRSNRSSTSSGPSTALAMWRRTTPSRMSRWRSRSPERPLSLKVRRCGQQRSRRFFAPVEPTVSTFPPQRAWFYAQGGIRKAESTSLRHHRAMADRKQLDFTYSLTDRIFRLSMGEMADFSGAKYDGDFSLSLEQAQRRKHEYVAEQLGLGPGRRMLDLGCGWGALLNFIRNRGATGVGVTLSSAQVAACRRHGLDVQLVDARQVSREGFGRFDAVASLGAFEHFCSPEDYGAGRQEE